MHTGNWSWHLGGTHFLFVDGSVQVLAMSVDDNLCRYLATRAEGEPIAGGF